MASKSRSISDSKIKRRFENHKYSIWNIPCALSFAKGKLYHFGKDVRYEDLIKAQNDSVKKVTTREIKVKLHYLSKLDVGVINKRFFHSRKDFDKLSHESMFEYHKFKEESVKRLGDLHFTNAMKTFRCEITYNFEYYLSKRKEIKEDELDEFQLENKTDSKQLEKSLLFKFLIDIFGDEKDKEEEEEQTIIFRDFHLILDDGSFQIATAERGDCYIAFFNLID